MTGPDCRVVNSSVEVTELDSGGRSSNPTIGSYFRSHKENFILVKLRRLSFESNFSDVMRFIFLIDNF